MLSEIDADDDAGEHRKRLLEITIKAIDLSRDQDILLLDLQPESAEKEKANPESDESVND